MFEPNSPIFVVFLVLHILSAACVLAAVFLAYKLYKETDKGWYWLSLLLSAFFFALSQWIVILFPIVQSFALIGVLKELSEIMASILFAVSCFGIYKTMVEIRKRVE
ncbi:hypothetical protein HY988_04400 [Candidatus Micrarchaeota archaeon]|nr:hypothetical protein [Candidatus Micrarchaeota archaeon]